MMTTNKKEPLVSIIVVTFNSSKYVFETLESIKNQTYQNIELLITDDCSTDDTLEVCEKWLVKNYTRFENSRIITSNKNSGVPANCNRGLNAANGTWIKFIAGDDLILEDGVSKLVDFQSHYPQASLIHGRVIFINQKSEITNKIPKKNRLIYPTFSEEFRSNKIFAPSVIFLKSALKEIGGFSDKYKIEDIYVYLKLLGNGKQAYYTNDQIVKYRLHQNNLSADNSLMLKEHIDILRTYKNHTGYKLNFFLFCRNVLLYNLLKHNISFKNLFLIINKNPLVLFSFLDIVFIFSLMKGLCKKLFQ